MMIFIVLISLLLLIVNISKGLQQNYPPPSPFDVKIANQSVYFSAAAACGVDNYKTMKVAGPNTEFKYLYTIYDKSTDTQGYIGIQSNQIWVIYRGTESYTNWLDDSEMILSSTDLCTDCKVHHGFLKCYTNTIDQVLTSLSIVTKEYPNYEIIVAGHSLGGAIATLVTAKLYNTKLYKPIHYSFGSPRVGNQNFATYCSNLFISSNRITHYKDMVPHVPYESLGYVHITSEIYEDENHQLHGCKGNDDPTCAEQWSFYQTKPDDHTLYLDLPMYCANATLSH